MIETELPAKDLADVRFGADPVWEATMSLHGITRRAPHRAHLSAEAWLRL